MTIRRKRGGDVFKQIELLQPGQKIQPYTTLPPVVVLGRERWERKGEWMITCRTTGPDITRKEGSNIRLV